ncbi:uncharacterized protein [Solanum tuberosum]|uniref:uncharacterized protein n=1 Tax=Solanum tuberosum TaxID=4113 RepID=UPI00073A5123|nr:PREDICTED: uncharacterized protein LOC102583313 [Solanum tuberosum]
MEFGLGIGMGMWAAAKVRIMGCFFFPANDENTEGFQSSFYSAISLLPAKLPFFSSPAFCPIFLFHFGFLVSYFFSLLSHHLPPRILVKLCYTTITLGSTGRRMLHGQNSYVESSSSSPMHKTVDPSQFGSDESN